MKRLFWIGLLAAMLTPARVMAQSAFDGTWKIDLNQTQLPAKPGVYLLQNGTYHCRTCIPPIDVRADGLDHRVAGDSCYDTVNINVLDDRTVQETDKSKGKIVHTEKITVAPSGKDVYKRQSIGSLGCEASIPRRRAAPAPTPFPRSPRRFAPGFARRSHCALLLLMYPAGAASSVSAPEQVQRKFRTAPKWQE